MHVIMPLKIAAPRALKLKKADLSSCVFMVSLPENTLCSKCVAGL